MTKLKERFRLSGEIEVEQWCDGNGNLGPCSCGDGPPSKGHWRLARTVKLDDVLEAARKQWDEETPAQWQDCTECAEKAKRAEKERDEARAQALADRHSLQNAHEALADAVEAQSAALRERDEARAEVEQLKAQSKLEQEHTNNYIRFLHKAEAKLKDVAERQREACAAFIYTWRMDAELCAKHWPVEDAVRAAPLVTENP